MADMEAMETVIFTQEVAFNRAAAAAAIIQITMAISIQVQVAWARIS